MKLVRLGVVGGFAAVAVVAVSNLTSTASGVVPPSRVGFSTRGVTAAALAPAVCRANGVTAASVLVSSDTSVSGTAAAELIIGTANGWQGLFGGGGKDCLVAGAVPAGKTVLLSPASASGSVCVKGPGPGSYSYGSGCAVKA